VHFHQSTQRAVLPTFDDPKRAAAQANLHVPPVLAAGVE